MATAIPLSRRIRPALRRRWDMWRRRGDAVACPCCGTRLRSFAPAANRADAVCPRCGSHERHRAVALYLEERADLFAPGTSLLHLAPEYALARRIRELPGLRYVTADLEPGAADLEADVTALPLEDDSFDAILCSHVLEHVPDDRAAIAELARVVKPGGEAIVLVPVDYGRETTYEDPAIVTPEERERAYWQHDHVRLYGRDFPDRLRAGGFDVQAVRMAERLGPEAAARHGLLPAEEIFVCRPRAR